MQKNSQKKKSIITYLPEIAAGLLLIGCWLAAAFAADWAYEEQMLYQTAAELMTEGRLPAAAAKLPLAACWYVHALAVFMRFLGMKRSAAGALELVLQAASALLLFAGVRRLFGRAVSVVSLVIMAAAFPFFFGSGQLSPELFFGIAAGICLLVLSVPAAAWKKRKKAKAALQIGSEKEKKRRSKEEKAVLSETESKEKENASKEIQYIPNPLPLPKRHVRREIQFDYEPSQLQLEFDHELKKGQEDFDI